MMLPLLLSLVVSAADDPPVKVWLNRDNYFQRGDKARVNVKLADDGYLIVLRADAEGRVRVLFPLDPSNDNFVRGHESVEVRGRGDREAFFVDDREGSGLVLAARSTAPFKFDEFVRGDHWDYRVLDARQAGDDKEAALVDLVQRMTTEGRFDYDAATYVVASARAYYDSYYPHYSAVSFGFGWGWPYRYRYSSLYSTCYDPFFYDPFACYDPIYYRPYRYGFYGYGYRPYIFYGGGYAIHNRSRNLFINRVRTGPGVQIPFRDRRGSSVAVAGAGPTFRVPDGALVNRRRPESTPVREAVQRDGRDRVTAFPVRERAEARDRGDRGDRPDRATPAAREPERRAAPERRGGGGGGDGGRAAPERRGGGGGGGGGGGAVSAPRGGGGDGGGRAAPANRGGGGGGGGNHGNSGGGSRRRP
jgi:uncharacterized protein DUF4384